MQMPPDQKTVVTDQPRLQEETPDNPAHISKSIHCVLITFLQQSVANFIVYSLRPVDNLRSLKTFN
jgi:hypothetical protein